MYTTNGKPCILALLALGLTACEAPRDDDAEASAAGEAAVTTLSEADVDAGWELLVDGDDLDGWKGYQSETVPARWVVEDGILHFDPDADGSGGDILTRDTFGDFELAFEWKISECGNSGVIYRAVDTSAYEQSYMTGPEYQVLDDGCHEGPNQTASNYDMHPATENAARPAGAWNESRIVADGPRVEHWLNGTMVVDYELWTDEWQALKADSKWNEYPDYGMAREGHIALQDHTDPVWYRNLRIRRLE